MLPFTGKTGGGARRRYLQGQSAGAGLGVGPTVKRTLPGPSAPSKPGPPQQAGPIGRAGGPGAGGAGRAAPSMRGGGGSIVAGEGDKKAGLDRLKKKMQASAISKS